MMRSALPSDLAIIKRLALRLSEQASADKEEEYKDPDLSFYVLVEEDEVIGYVLLRDEREEGEIDEIVIQKEKEGCGRGKKLLIDIIKEASERGMKRLLLEVRAKNERAIKLYESCGFVPYRRRKNYYQDDDAICYLKELTYER